MPSHLSSFFSQNIHVMERVNFRIYADIFHDFQNELKFIVMLVGKLIG